MEAVRPSPEELAAIHAEMARARETLRPSPEELEVLRVELREELAGLRTEAASGLAEWRAELERLRREHEVR